MIVVMMVVVLVVMLVLAMQADYMNTSLLCCLEMMWPHRRSSDWASYKDKKSIFKRLKQQASYKDKSLLKCEDQNKNEPDERPSDGDPLPFSSGQLHPSLPDHCLVLRGKIKS